ncbi:hypothetical protein D3C85_594800 [compost metagenome]
MGGHRRGHFVLDPIAFAGEWIGRQADFARVRQCVRGLPIDLLAGHPCLDCRLHLGGRNHRHGCCATGRPNPHVGAGQVYGQIRAQARAQLCQRLDRQRQALTHGLAADLQGEGNARQIRFGQGLILQCGCQALHRLLQGLHGFRR